MKKNNSTIDLMQTRRSVRHFSGEGISKEDLDTIIKSAQQSSNSINGQQVSLIITEDKDTIKKIAELTGGQKQVESAEKFITVVIDFNRTDIANKINNEQQYVHKTLEGILTGAVDAGIMVQAIQLAATALEIGTTIIGAIRNSPQEIIELFNLPKKTFPVVGIMLGKEEKQKKAQVKPRVDIDSFAFYEKYDTKKVEEGVKSYDKILRNWFDSQDITNIKSYIDVVSHIYSKPYYSKVKPTLIRQEFDIE